MTAPLADEKATDNRGERDYGAKIRRIAEKLKYWPGPIIVLGHVDPDGDALGSSLALKRALESLGKSARLPMTPPRFLRFLALEDELDEPLQRLPEGCLAVVLDTAERGRAAGAPLDEAGFIVNIDHHGTNDRYGDLACVEPGRAATAQIVKDVIDKMGINWTPDIAAPCLVGILTDTGFFRYANTSPEVLSDAGELISHGVDYAALSDRLQWRHPDYYWMMAKVLGTLDFPLSGLAVTAELTLQMTKELGPTDDDSDDYVGLIRYAEGAQVALFFKEREDHTKVSVRSRGEVSAQAICLRLGGGGHVAAAGAKLFDSLETTRALALQATAEELRERGYEPGR
jgi:bifunctional oligoribonuclease and PAP phosphatase NrnA